MMGQHGLEQLFPRATSRLWQASNAFILLGQGFPLAYWNFTVLALLENWGSAWNRGEGRESSIAQPKVRTDVLDTSHSSFHRKWAEVSLGKKVAHKDSGGQG